MYSRCVEISRFPFHFFVLWLSIRSSISRNVRIFGSSTSLIMMSRATDVPSRNLEAKLSAYSIHTQLAQPDMQQFVGGLGIWAQFEKILSSEQIESQEKTIVMRIHTSSFCPLISIFCVEGLGGFLASPPFDDEHCVRN